MGICDSLAFGDWPPEQLVGRFGVRGRRNRGQAHIHAGLLFFFGGSISIFNCQDSHEGISWLCSSPAHFLSCLLKPNPRERVLKSLTRFLSTLLLVVRLLGPSKLASLERQCPRLSRIFTSLLKRPNLKAMLTLYSTV